MQKKSPKPLVLRPERVKPLTDKDLTQVEGGGHIPPKLHPVEQSC